MMFPKSETYSILRTVPVDAPEGYKQSELMWIRREAGNKIFELLYQRPLPAIVDIEEHIGQANQSMYDFDRLDVLRIDITITNVQYRHVEILTDHHGILWTDFPEGIVAKIKRRIRRWFRRRNNG